MSHLPKSKNKKNRIFIVDDHPLIRKGLAQLINQEDDMMLIGEAANAAEAMRGITKAKPDLVTMDISLEGTINGIELTKNILARQPQMPVLMVSMYDESVYLERVLKIGARGYLQKNEAFSHIVLAIRNILRGELYVSDKWKDKILHQFVVGATPTKSSFNPA